MKVLALAVATIALLPTTAHAQLLGGGGGLGGGLGGSLGGTLGGTLGGSIERPVTGTLDRTTRTVRGSIDANGSTSGTQSVDARRGTVSAERSASGSVFASSASLADIVVPAASPRAEARGNGAASGQGSANAQLIGTDAVTGTIAPIAQDMRTRSGNAISAARTTAMPGGANASGSGSGSGALAGGLTSAPLAVAGSAAAAGQGAATVSRGMPVTLPDGSSLGKVRQIIANGRGEVEQIVVRQGDVTRALPAGMFSASGNALVLTQMEGAAASSGPAEQPAE